MMDAKDCNDAIEKLPLFVGGDLDPEVLSAVARHLEACPACRAEEARAAEAREALVRAFEDEVRGGGPNLWPGIRATLVREGLVRETRRPVAATARGPARRVARIAAYAAAAAAAALIGFALWRGDDAGSADRGLPAAEPIASVLVAEPRVAAVAGGEDGSASAPAPGLRASGLTPILDAGDRLSTQVGPDVGTYTLTSSPVR